MAPDSEDILEPILSKNSCTISRNLPTGHLCNVREDCSTGALALDFRTDHPTDSTDPTGRSQGQKLVRTLKLTNFENYFSFNCTSFYVFCKINKNDFHILYVYPFCTE